METVDLKNSVLKYIDDADRRLLEMMLALAENYRNRSTSALNEEDYKEMDKRRLDHLNEKSESYSWEEVQKKAKNALKE